MKLPREELVIITKYDVHLHGKNPADYGIINQHDFSRTHIFDAVKASLERLQLEYIEVLQCRAIASIMEHLSMRRSVVLLFICLLYVPLIHAMMHALHAVVQTGYVRYIGMIYAMQISRATDYALQNKLTPFISVQNHHSLIHCEEAREMFPTTLKMFGVAAIPWRALGRGILTRPLSAVRANETR
ncbi:hypothetical protein FOMPIDRAFT_1055216 [Fomitopsis schrenkii]|uniref:NADP-dependent oxidoreductase domain-containing protein n=1 Tax=Fomitopsis schrenkii TaxID=2126942 RepID=S8DST1_FOMSC|nr:hypothetical protein FOMPIDRAFT_1055216 [Fomitopsis schrenkii]